MDGGGVGRSLAAGARDKVVSGLNLNSILNLSEGCLHSPNLTHKASSHIASRSLRSTSDID